MYALLGSCKLHGVEPFAYHRDVIARIPEHKASKPGELLPQNWRPFAKGTGSRPVDGRRCTVQKTLAQSKGCS